jgi:outer membrane biogenesis lipoprotein LolB
MPKFRLALGSVVGVVVLSLAACTTVSETRQQVFTQYQQSELQKTLAGRFAIRLQSDQAGHDRGAQGRFDWLHYKPTPGSDQSRYVLIWSSTLGQALGRIEWWQNGAASEYQVFNEKNELLAPEARAEALARLLGRTFEDEAMNEMLSALTQSFITAEADGTDTFEWRHADLLVLLRILVDPT